MTQKAALATASCEICSHAIEYGSWPLDHHGTHCMDCHRSWRAKAQSHCAACHRHFGSNSAGDAHSVGDYRHGRTPICRDPKGYPRWETPDGPIFGGRDPEVAKRSVSLAAASRKGSVVDQRATK